MTELSLARPAALLLGAAVIAACSSGGAATTASSAPAPAPSSTTTATTTTSGAGMNMAMPPGVTMAMIATGDSLFHARNCKTCHGADAKGAQNGPDLTSGHFTHISGSYEDIVKIVTTGIPKDQIKDPSHQFAMRPGGGGNTPLTQDQIRAVAAYVYTLSHP